MAGHAGQPGAGGQLPAETSGSMADRGATPALVATLLPGTAGGIIARADTK